MNDQPTPESLISSLRETEAELAVEQRGIVRRLNVVRGLILTLLSLKTDPPEVV